MSQYVANENVFSERLKLSDGKGRDRGRRGYWVTLYLFIYTAWLLVSVFRYVPKPDTHIDMHSHSAQLTPSAQAKLSGACGQGL